MTTHYKKLFLMNILLSSLPFYFISMLLLRQLGFSYTTIGIFFVITEIFGSVFDIPLSYLSNQVGYKRLLLLSQLFLIIGLGCLMGRRELAVFSSAIFMGLSESLSSGLLNAYNFEVIGQEQVYDKFLKDLNGVKYLFIALVTIISPYLLDKHIWFPLILSIIFTALSFLLLLHLPEIRHQEEAGQKLTEAFKHHKNIPWHLVCLGVIFSSLIMVSNSYATVLLNESGLSTRWLGLVLFAFNLCMSLGSRLNLSFITSLLLPILVIFIAFLDNPLLQLPCFFATRVLNANYNNHFYSKFNRAIQHHRAISWSVYNFSMSIAFILSDAVTGLIADSYGIQMVYLIFGSLALFFLIYSLLKKVKY